MWPYDEERRAKGLWWDRAWGLVSGCTEVDEGCRNCWARREAHVRGKQQNPKIQARYGGLVSEDGSRWIAKTVRFNADLLDIHRNARKPQVWAVWNDLGHSDLRETDRDAAFCAMRDSIGNRDAGGNAHKAHHFVVLTKRPSVLIQSLDRWLHTTKVTTTFYWRDNVWMGTSTTGRSIESHRVREMLRWKDVVLDNTVLSVEPCLGSADDLERLLDYAHQFAWVIIGAETGAKRMGTDPRLMLKFARGLQNDGVRVWVKHLGRGEVVPDGLRQGPVELKVSACRG